MQANFAFYIHHHGSGHFMRALAIASHLKNARIIFLGSDLKRFANLIPAHIQCVHLPMDVATEEDKSSRMQQLDFLHYAPLNVSSLLTRNELIINTLKENSPLLLIVDVSVEVTLLATLCGVPTVVIRQNGKRNDTAHLNAYQSAQLLLAPCSETLMDHDFPDWVHRKTLYSGGFSRYATLQKSNTNTVKNKIGVIVGAGGTSIDAALVNEIASQCVDYTFEIIGQVSQQPQLSQQIIYHGSVEDPADILMQCEVVIGNAGNNTVMEMAALNKKFICVTEDRPFDEQVCKGAQLEANGMAVVVAHYILKNQDWNLLINKAQQLPENCWAGVISPDALDVISRELDQKWKSIFAA